MMAIDERTVQAQFEISQQHSAQSGAASYRQPDPGLVHVLVGHHYGYDHVAIRLASRHSDWKQKTAVLDVACSTIAGAPKEFGNRAYLIRYPSSERDRLKRFVLELVEKTDPLDVVASTDALIDAWSKLWGPIQGPLSIVQQRGIFGELLTLERFAQANGSGVVCHWDGPKGSLHDFPFPSKRVEVKTAGHESPVIEVSSFNQLKPCEPKLVLLMVQIRERGELTLPMLVERIRRSLEPFQEEMAEFESRLKQARYLDDHAAHYDTPYDEFLFSTVEIDDSIDVLHEGRLDQPVAGLIEARWSLDPGTLPFARVDEGFWAI